MSKRRKGRENWNKKIKLFKARWVYLEELINYLSTSDYSYN